MARSAARCLVTGRPASGKPTVAEHLRATVRWPLITKDAIKERLFATALDKSLASNAALGPAAWELLHYIREVVMLTGAPVIAEGNFRPAARPRLHSVLVRHGYDACETVLHAALDILRGRFLVRLNDPARHAGHTRGIDDPARYIEKTVREPYAPMTLSEPVIYVDTGDWSRVILSNLVRLAGA